MMFTPKMYVKNFFDNIRKKKEDEYHQKVVEYIREKYSLNDELSLLRQRYEKTEEFKEFNSFCEECKKRAKGEVYD